MRGRGNAFLDHHEKCTLEDGMQQLHGASLVPSLDYSIGVVVFQERGQHAATMRDHEHDLGSNEWVCGNSGTELGKKTQDECFHHG